MNMPLETVFKQALQEGKCFIFGKHIGAGMVGYFFNEVPVDGKCQLWDDAGHGLTIEQAAISYQAVKRGKKPLDSSFFTAAQ